MRNKNFVTFKQFTIKPVFRKSSADVILGKNDDILDYISLGTVCLSKSLFGSESNVIKVAKHDFSKDAPACTAYLGRDSFPVPSNSFVKVSCDYYNDIANYIGDGKYINNMTLGPIVSMTLAICLMGKDSALGTEEHMLSLFTDMLPSHWDMSDTVAAQELAYDLVQKMFQIVVEPIERPLPR